MLPVYMVVPRQAARYADHMVEIGLHSQLRSTLRVVRISPFLVWDSVSEAGVAVTEVDTHGTLAHPVFLLARFQSPREVF